MGGKLSRPMIYFLGGHYKVMEVSEHVNYAFNTLVLLFKIV